MAEHVVIIGSGPAGWSAAIYAARADLRPLLIEGKIKPEMIPLGQLAFTTEVENYAGFPAGNIRAFVESAVDRDRHYNLPPAPKGHERDGQPHYAVQGVELMELMKQQALNFGTRVVSDEEIVGVDFSGKPLRVQKSNGEWIETHTVIVATGARANYLGLPSEERFKNRGVSACAVCDGALPRFRNQPLVVVGGGDSAVEEATYLSKYAQKVYLVHRRDQLRASKIMQDRALNNPKIEPVWNAMVDEVLGNDEQGVTGVRLKSTVNDSTWELATVGMFVAIGHTPNTDFLKGHIDLSDKGYIRWTTPFRTYTSVDGVFAAGDVADDNYRQAITSSGTGCMAALDAERYLAALGL
ncbi:MAG: FAD-dependent oxidoreductase [Pirellulales bacterium]